MTTKHLELGTLGGATVRCGSVRRRPDARRIGNQPQRGAASLTTAGALAAGLRPEVQSDDD